MPFFSSWCSSSYPSGEKIHPLIPRVKIHEKKGVKTFFERSIKLKVKLTSGAFLMTERTILLTEWSFKLLVYCMEILYPNHLLSFSRVTDS